MRLLWLCSITSLVVSESFKFCVYLLYSTEVRRCHLGEKQGFKPKDMINYSSTTSKKTF